MAIIKVGSTYRIYPSDVELLNKGLPAKTYRINFSPMSGFSLEERERLECKENKVYGNHESKADKIIRSYKKMNRNFGVLISGDKGIGKTLTIQMLSSKLLKEGIPTIIVDENYSGLPGFIESIKQECLFVFDEFEKKFPSNSENGCSQEDLLSLFDGLSPTKHLYAVTVNEVNRVNSYFLNRPGRFHYHIKYSYPTRADVISYLNHHNPDANKEDINKIAELSSRAKLNFDMLRAISFELSIGSTVEELLEDLNIEINNNNQKMVMIKTNKKTLIELADVSLFGEIQKINFGYDADDLSGLLEFTSGSMTYMNGELLLDISKIINCNIVDCTEEDEDGDYLKIELKDILSVSIIENFVDVNKYVL